MTPLRRLLVPPLLLSFEVSENDGLAAGGSDHGSFLRAGVPGFFWQQTGRSDYGRVWHSQHDTLESAVPEYLEHSALVVAIGALGLANDDALLDRRAMRRPPPRRTGVYLEDTLVTGLSGGGRAGEAGWLEGDRVLAVDGSPVASRREIADAVHAGGPSKRFTLERGGERVESVLDRSEDPGEEERRRHRTELEGARRAIAASSRP